MSGWVLLIIGLASLTLVLACLAYVGLKGWRVYERGMRVYADVTPFADQFASWSMIVEAKVAELGDTSVAIAENVASLQASLQRFQIIAEALSEGAAPYRRVLRYFGR